MEDPGERLPAAIVVTGPGLASQTVLFEQLAATPKSGKRTSFICLSSGQAPNLKTFLKHVISKGSSRANSLDDDEDQDEIMQDVQRKRPRLLNYDLQILQDAVEEQSLSKVVICFQDCEAFDGALMSDAIELLRYLPDVQRQSS